MWHKYAVSILALALCFSRLALGVVTWNGTTTDDVTNSDLIIHNCTFARNPTITASSGDWRAYLDAGSATVDGSSHTLYINVSVGSSFTFDLTGDYDLDFAGGAGTQVFQVIQTGAGRVIFKLKGGRTFTLRSVGGNLDGGVRYYSKLDQIGQTPAVGLVWQYDRTASLSDRNKNAVIALKNGSLLTFIASNTPDVSTEIGGLGVYASNEVANSGTLLLDIENRAGFIATGHLYSSGIVSLGTLAGHQTNVQLLNEGAGGLYTNRFLVINSNTVLSQLFSDPTRTLATPDGVQHGFILGAGSQLLLKNGTYLDYVGTAPNGPSLTSSAAVLQGKIPDTLLKARNPSALTIDSSLAYDTAQNIVMYDESGIFLRSACDAAGHYHQSVPLTNSALDFSISSTAQPGGAGNVVFDVEAPLYSYGVKSELATNLNVFNVLSRAVAPTGGHIEIGGDLTVFPLFTNAVDTAGVPVQYAKACCLVNNRVNLTSTIIRHDDITHVINATNTPLMSEPVYIGGETFKLVPAEALPRPTIALYNSQVRLHTSGATTGVDYLVTADVDTPNISNWNFYANGRVVDNGTGRAMVLGTTTGSYAYDEATIVDASSHVDIYQESALTSAVTHELTMTTDFNNNEWNPLIPVGADLSGQYSVQTVFLGEKSNVQIGSQNSPVFQLLTSPTLNINGNFFSFMSKGGSISQPDLSASTGEGGIFVDRNGVITLAPSARANFGLMVVKGATTASINLPKDRAYFNSRVGIGPWELNLASQNVIVPAGQHLSDYTIDWMATKKDFAGGFVPFNPTGTLVQPITSATLTNIPTVNGEVDQLQVKRSRLGDQVHLMVDGGKVRELVFLTGYDSAESATGLAVLKNNGQLGIGNNFTNYVSNEANVVLGTNGLTLAADGDGVVNLYTDVVVNSLCGIVTGPNFGSSGVQALYIHSTDEHEIRIKNGGVLDLTTFTNANQELVFDGKINLVLEPGATVIFGGGTFYFDGQSKLTIDQASVPAHFVGTAITSLDAYRAVIMGSGKLIFEQDTQLVVNSGSYLGVQSVSADGARTVATNLALSLIDNAKFLVGSLGNFGGAVQIGNTQLAANDVRLTLTLNGIGATWQIASQGFFGVGAGIADKQATNPNAWQVGQLFNVKKFRLELTQGTIYNNMIHKGDAPSASMLVFGPMSNNNYQLSIGRSFYDMSIFGGGNMVLTTQAGLKTYPVMNAVSSNVGIFASQAQLTDESKTARFAALVLSGSAQNFFNVFMCENITAMASPSAPFAFVSRGTNKVAYVFGTAINRAVVSQIIGGLGQIVSPINSLAIGSLALNFDRATGVVNSFVEINQ